MLGLNVDGGTGECQLCPAPAFCYDSRKTRQWLRTCGWYNLYSEWFNNGFILAIIRVSSCFCELCFVYGVFLWQSCFGRLVSTTSNVCEVGTCQIAPPNSAMLAGQSGEGHPVLYGSSPTLSVDKRKIQKVCCWDFHLEPLFGWLRINLHGMLQFAIPNGGQQNQGQKLADHDPMEGQPVGPPVT